MVLPSLLAIVMFVSDLPPGAITVPVKTATGFSDTNYRVMLATDIAKCPPWIDVSRKEQSRGIPLRSLFSWIPAEIPAWIIRDERGLQWARRRGFIHLGDKVVVERVNGGTPRRWYEIEYTLFLRKSDGARQWRTTRNESAKIYALKWRVTPLITAPWVPTVAHNMVEPSKEMP
jgi:hypothetical protein